MERTKSRTDSGENARARPQGLTLVYCPDPTARGFSIPLTDAITVGRDPDHCNLALSSDERASRTHARIFRRGDETRIEDLGSRNGTFVNGERTQQCALAPEDIVRIGDALMLFTELFDEPREAFPDVAGNSWLWQALLGEARQLAREPFPVLLLGETGSGKEVLAECLHRWSGRSGELVAVNCAALPASLFESQLFGHARGAFTGATHAAGGYFDRARGGTLFLDEIGELAHDLQPKLLRVLETGEYQPVGGDRPQRSDARIVAASNVALDQAPPSAFRRDVYARLAVGILHVPPLRARRADILPLAEHFFAKRGGVTLEALGADVAERLLLHSWPLNVRELRSLAQWLGAEPPMSGAKALAAVLEWLERSSPARTAGAEPAKKNKRRKTLERDALLALLARHEGIVARVAEELGCDRRQVYRWLELYELEPDKFRSLG